MRALRKATIVSMVFFTVVLGAAGAAWAQDSTDSRLQALENRLRQQDLEIERLRSELSSQQDATSTLSEEIEAYLAKGDNASWWDEPNTLRAFFKPGLRFESADKQFQLRVGGRIMFDLTFPDADDDVKDAFEEDFDDNLYEFRRARFFMQGKIYDVVIYKAQYDFAGQEVEFKDLFIGVELADEATVRVGNMKEPFSLEELTSSKYISFMERGLPNVFAPGRHPGIQVTGAFMDDKLNYGVGWFFDNEDEFSEGVIENCFTARVAFAPWYEDKGEKLAHLGAAVSIRDEEDETRRYRQRPEVHNTIRLVDTGNLMDVDGVTLFGLEGAVVFGPFSVQAEYMMANVESDMYDDPSFSGFYIYGSWFITGEHRAYKEGAFDRVKPNQNFLDGQGGTGAWELLLRYSMLDLTDGDVEGGELSDITVGLNWYLNPATRVMFNYVYANVENGDLDGNFSAFQIRFQIDF